MRSKSRSKSKKSAAISAHGNVRTKLYSTWVRRTLHTFVVSLYLIALGWFGYRCLQALQVPEIADTEFVSHGVTFMPYYFSFWVSALQYVYFFMYSIIDTLEILSERRKHLHRTIDRMHTIASYLLFTVVFPLSLMVGILFWSFYHWDRNVIYPPILDEWVSPWPNHVMHTLPIPLSLVYMLVSNKKEPPKLLTLSGLLMFLGVYGCIFFSVKISSGKYVYLCLEKFPPTGVPFALSFGLLSPIVFHSLGYKINDYFKKIQQPAEMRTMLFCAAKVRKIWHATVILNTVVACGWFANRVFRMSHEVPGFSESDFLVYGRRNMPYLFSIWVSAVQVAYFGMYAFIDVLEVVSKKEKILLVGIGWMQAAASFLHFSLVFPSTMTVGTVYWMTYLWDPTDIKPTILDDYLPRWCNHVLYTLPMFLCLIYMLSSSKQQPSKWATLGALLSFLSVYGYIIFRIRVTTGKWVHLIFERLSPVQFSIILTSAIITPIFFHYLGHTLKKIITSISS